MNKKFFLLGAGALATAGFLTLTAFGGMTKAQQDAGIADKVTAALAELKTAKAKECEDKVAAAANVKAQEILAAPTAAPTVAGKGGPSKTPAKKPATKGKKDPVPSAPSVPPATAPKVDPQKERGGQTAPEVQKQRGGTNAPTDQKKRGGATSIEPKKEGGN